MMWAATRCSTCWYRSNFRRPRASCRSERRPELVSGRPPAKRRLAQLFFYEAQEGTLLRKLSPKVASWSHLSELFSKCRSKIPKAVTAKKGLRNEFGLGEVACYRAETAQLDCWGTPLSRCKNLHCHTTLEMSPHCRKWSVPGCA